MMKKRNIGLFAIALSVGTGCRSPDNPQPASRESGGAHIAVRTQGLTSADVSRVGVAISAADMSDVTVNLERLAEDHWAGLIAFIPAGPDRTFTANAYDAGDILIFTDSVTVDIAPGAVAQVVFHLQEVVIESEENHPPVILSAAAESDVVAPGGTIDFAISAADPDGDAVTTAYQATGGSFDPMSGSTTTWTAPFTPGTYVLTAIAADPAGLTDTIEFEVLVGPSTGAANVVTASFNLWPRIDSIAASDSSIPLGATITLIAAVSDADADVLEYAWTDNCGGALSAPAASSTDWTAPSSSAACVLSLAVADGRGGSAHGELAVAVGEANGVNFAPAIDLTYQSAAEVASEGTVVFEVQAHDREGSGVFITWSATCGSFDSTSAFRVEWTAPLSAATCAVRAEVSDDQGAQTDVDFEVVVLGAECAPGVAGGQSPLFAHTFGGATYDSGGDAIQTADGGFAMVGTTEGSAGFYLVRTDPTGSLLWERRYAENGNNDSGARTLLEAPGGGFALVGRMNGGPFGSFDARLLLVDASGDPLFDLAYGGSGQDSFSGVVALAGGGFAMCGQSDSFGGSRQGWLVVTDGAGSVLVNRAYGTAGFEGFSSIATLPGGGFLLAGSTSSGGAGGDDGWVVRTNAAGDVITEQTFGAGGNEYLQRAIPLANGDIALGGLTNSSGEGIYDFWFLRADPSGQVVWSATHGGPGDDEMFDLIALPDGYAAVGYTTSFGSGGLDLWFVRVGATGGFLASSALGGSAEDMGFGLAPVAGGGFIIAGRTYSSGAGNGDAWLVRTDGCGAVQ